MEKPEFSRLKSVSIYLSIYGLPQKVRGRVEKDHAIKYLTDTSFHNQG